VRRNRPEIAQSPDLSVEISATITEAPHQIAKNSPTAMLKFTARSTNGRAACPQEKLNRLTYH
jgi:hypothetical protein